MEFNFRNVKALHSNTNFKRSLVKVKAKNDVEGYCIILLCE